MSDVMDQYGLLPTGFNAPTFDVIEADVETDLRNAFGASIPITVRSLFGNVSRIFSERELRLWNLGQALNDARSPQTAFSAALEDLSAITGTLRDAAKASTVTETLTGTPGTSVPSSSRVRTVSTQAPFTTQADTVIVALTAWAAMTGYTVGVRRTNAGNAYVCIASGTSAGSGGPSTNAADITDGTVHWRFMGAGTGAVDVAMASVDKAAVTATSGDLTQIDTPIGGWSGAINLLDATIGAPTQVDPDLRQAREQELATAGAATHDAIVAQVREVLNVTAVTVFNNDTDVTDVNGVPPHSVLVLVQGGVDADIAAALFASVGDGIATVGTTAVDVLDSEGVTQTMRFQRPTLVPIYVRATVTYDAAKYPADGDAEVESAIATWGTAQAAGKDAVPRGAGAQAFAVAGVDDADVLLYTDVIGAPVAWAATTAYVATVGARSVVTNDGGRAYICTTGGTSAGSGGPTGTGTDITDGTVHWRYLGAAIAIDRFSLATWDTSRIVVSSSAATP